MKTALFSCARNEGPFILEWVAYHRMIGFDPIVVFTNDCDDGTDELLDRLAVHGVVHHVRQRLTAGQVPQHTAADAAFGHPAIARADWLMWIDTDEFLVLADPEFGVSDLVAALGAADGICVNWKLFGDSGLDSWSPGLVTRRFTRRAENLYSRHVMFKTLFRRSEDIRGFGLHRPFLHASFRSRSNRFLVNGNGTKMPEETYRCGKWKRHALGAMPSAMIAYDLASLFHYAVKTRDSYELKRERGQGTKGVRTEGYNSRFGDRYWTTYNRNEIEDCTMHAVESSLRQQISDLLELPGLHEAQEACTARYLQKLTALEFRRERGA